MDRTAHTTRPARRGTWSPLVRSFESARVWLELRTAYHEHGAPYGLRWVDFMDWLADEGLRELAAQGDADAAALLEVRRAEREAGRHA